MEAPRGDGKRRRKVKVKFRNFPVKAYLIWLKYCRNARNAFFTSNNYYSKFQYYLVFKCVTNPDIPWFLDKIFSVLFADESQKYDGLRTNVAKYHVRRVGKGFFGFSFDSSVTSWFARKRHGAAALPNTHFGSLSSSSHSFSFFARLALDCPRLFPIWPRSVRNLSHHHPHHRGEDRAAVAAPSVKLGRQIRP